MKFKIANLHKRCHPPRVKKRHAYLTDFGQQCFHLSRWLLVYSDRGPWSWFKITFVKINANRLEWWVVMSHVSAKAWNKFLAHQRWNKVLFTTTRNNVLILPHPKYCDWASCRLLPNPRHDWTGSAAVVLPSATTTQTWRTKWVRCCRK